MFLNEQNIGTSFAEIQQPEIIAPPNWMVTKNRLLDEFFLLESLLLKKDAFSYKHEVPPNDKCIKERNNRVRWLVLLLESFKMFA